MAMLIKTVILKEDMPSVEQARARLQGEIHAAQQSGIKVLKVVHGYGSTGVGGDLRIALQSTLRQMVRSARFVTASMARIGALPTNAPGSC
jgi:DNA-nicking Smr family endonuclease